MGIVQGGKDGMGIVQGGKEMRGELSRVRK